MAVLDLHDLARLAREFAMNIKPRKTLLEAFKLTEEDFAKIEQLDFYQQTFKIAVKEWGKISSTDGRIQAMSKAMLEQVLPTIAGRVKNEKEPLNAVVEAGKFLANAAGRGSDREAPSSAAEKFVIQINMGANRVKHFEKEIVQHKPEPLTIEAPKDKAAKLD